MQQTCASKGALHPPGSAPSELGSRLFFYVLFSFLLARSCRHSCAGWALFEDELHPADLPFFVQACLSCWKRQVSLHQTAEPSAELPSRDTSAVTQTPSRWVHTTFSAGDGEERFPGCPRAGENIVRGYGWREPSGGEPETQKISTTDAGLAG